MAIEAPDVRGNVFRHVEKNSSLSNWIDGFLATAAREWLATRKSDE
jgi:hypothetical protein